MRLGGLKDAPTLISFLQKTHHVAHLNRFGNTSIHDFNDARI